MVNGHASRKSTEPRLSALHHTAAVRSDHCRNDSSICKRVRIRANSRFGTRQVLGILAHTGATDIAVGGSKKRVWRVGKGAHVRTNEAVERRRVYQLVQ